MDSVGSRRLARHLEKHKLTLDAFAAKVGTSKALVWSWRRGVKVPGTRFAVLIERETKIPPSAWLRPSREDSPQRTS